MRDKKVESIQKITIEELVQMKDREGLVLHGCGGDPKEWLDGINRMLAEEGILLGGSRFEFCCVFEHNGRTNILFPFGDETVQVGRLAMWRLNTYQTFGGVWLSDYLENHELVHEGETPKAAPRQKPDCPLIGQDGNIFNLMGIASRTLRQNGMGDMAKEMCEKITNSGSYHEALSVIGEYVNITSAGEKQEADDDFDEDMKLN